MTKPKPKAPTTMEIVKGWRHLNDHAAGLDCPVCGKDCQTIGITKITVSYEVCTCREGVHTYDHLVEQLWHRSCFVQALGTRQAAPFVGASR